MRKAIFITLVVIGLLGSGFLVYVTLNKVVEESKVLVKEENHKAFIIDSLQKVCIYKDAQIKSLEWVLDQTRPIEK